MANLVVAQLLFLESENPEKDIALYINSPGGSVSAGLAIYDTMQFIKPDVSTICVGQAASMGAVLLAGGAKGKRFCLPHSRVMIHQPLGGFQGQATDIEIHAREILDARDRLNAILAKHTGQPIDKISQDTDRDNFMTRRAGDRIRPDRRRAAAARRAAPRCPSDCERSPGHGTVKSLSRRRFLRGLVGAHGISHQRVSRRLSRAPGRARNARSGHGGRFARQARRRQASLLLLLRQEPARSPQADRRTVGVRLRRVRRALQRHHSRGARGKGREDPREAAEAARDQASPRRVRDRPGARQEGAVGRGLQPLQAAADQDAASDRATTSSSPRATSC